jgi:hypothetical protein
MNGMKAFFTNPSKSYETFPEYQNLCRLAGQRKLDIGRIPAPRISDLVYSRPRQSDPLPNFSDTEINAWRELLGIQEI